MGSCTVNVCDHWITGLWNLVGYICSAILTCAPRGYQSTYLHTKYLGCKSAVGISAKTSHYACGRLAQ